MHVCGAGNETFERLATFGLFANFQVYLTRELHVDQVSAANIMSIWYGVTNFGPLIGAFVSDAYLGRFNTIAFASFPSLLVCVCVCVYLHNSLALCNTLFLRFFFLLFNPASPSWYSKYILY